MNDIKFNKILILVNGAIPLALLSWDAFRGQLGANPIEFFLRTTGMLTLIFLLITLSVTPLRKLLGWNSLIKYRRLLGLYAFFYVCLHFSTYIIFDRGGNLASTAGDIVQRPFIAIGMASFFMMIPLAITSTNGWVKRLGGKRWAKLHRLIYYIGIGGVVHYWMIVKSDIFYPAMFGLVLAILLGYRVYVSNGSKEIQTIKSK
ncbi:MAG TPA: protein-methionine-sulfoxide reductase heme-binding subunit MsrQ [Pyrinomonadaceae bacterium]|jgi:sulfoxide reductase heme-binding subunit YedZ|nr:protein-methionine-sulfoxide reductase heme-binding subunit MsrQ [Pyrinomonadaceae bacterium]